MIGLFNQYLIWLYRLHDENSLQNARIVIDIFKEYIIIL